MRRRLRLVEAAPQLTKFADIELREARSRLPVAIGLSTRHSRSVLASRCGRSKPVDWSVIGILVTRHLATGFAQSSNGRSRGMRQPTEALSNLNNRSALGSLEHPDQLCTLCAGLGGLAGASVKDSHSSSSCRIPTALAEPWAALSPLQQCAHVRDRVGIAFQAVRILFGLQFNLQPDAVRIIEVEGLTIAPFDNFGHGDSMVLEPVVDGVKFLRRVHW